ncbi:MAG TPA: paraquat-inducible protein A [Opitutaceae bacterium]|jgi:paraquat-inducible protein A
MTRARIFQGLRGTSASAALALGAVIMLIPANTLPVLTTATTGINRSDTIFSGVAELWRRGFAPIAIIVFAASIVIPFLKIAGLGWLIYNVRHGGPSNPRRLTRIYVALDFIGRWSMLDVFLAAFLTGLVRFGALAMVQARAGIVAFAAAVVLTVLATRAFDPRSIWAKPAADGAPSS